MYQKILAEYDEAQRSMKDEEGIGGASVALRVEIYPGFSLVELLHYCALIGRELQSVEIFS